MWVGIVEVDEPVSRKDHSSISMSFVLVLPESIDASRSSSVMALAKFIKREYAPIVEANALLLLQYLLRREELSP